MPTYEVKDGRIYFTTHYNPGFIFDVKQIPGRIYIPETKQWHCPVNDITLKQIKELVVKNSFINVGRAEDDILYHPDDETVSERILNGLEHKIQGKLSMPFNLYPYQKEAIAYQLTKRSVINAADMGLGKTIMAIVSVEVEDLFPCLVVTPASVKYNWLYQWGVVNTSRAVTVINDITFDKSSDVFIINYDSLGRSEKNDNGDVRVNLKYEELANIKFKSVICDEAQNVKNSKTLRSRVLKKLIKGVDYRFMLTGTPVLNRPSEMINLLSLIGVFDKLFGGWKNYVYKYCDAKITRYGYDISGASNLIELNDYLKQHCYYRVEKRDVLKDLPERVDTVLYVDIENRNEYESAKNDLINYLKENFGQLKADKALMAEQLVLINTLLRLSAVGKFEQITGWIDDYLESSVGKLVVFGVHVELLKQLAEKYSCDLIIGEVEQRKRFDIVKSFQKNKKRVLFMNIQTGGVGIDGLQNVASDVLFVEMPWRYADIEQAVSRLERVGQRDNIFAYFMLGRDTIDIDMWNMILKKRQVTDGVNKGVDFDSSKYMSELMGRIMGTSNL